MDNLQSNTERPMCKCLTCAGHHLWPEGGYIYDVTVNQGTEVVRAFVCDECIERYPQMRVVKIVNPQTPEASNG